MKWIRTFVQPKPLAMGYLYAALEVRPMVCGLPPWYDPLEEQKPVRDVLDITDSFKPQWTLI